jgi:hypothetical protein
MLLAVRQHLPELRAVIRPSTFAFVSEDTQDSQTVLQAVVSKLLFLGWQ